MIAFLIALLCLFAAHSAEAQWTEPVLVDSYTDTLGVNVTAWDWCPFVTADESKMYFASDRSPQLDHDLYISTWSGQAWSNAVKLPFCVPGVDERNPAVNVTDDTLYFISIGPGWWDIFWSFRIGPSDTSWSQPQAMLQPINSGGIEFSVWITPDNQRLLFSSARGGGNGGEDIYQCRRDFETETGWSTPQLLTGALNSWTSESYPSMGFDTTEIFFQRTGYTGLYISQLSDFGWSEGELLPDNINRVIQQFPSETTPCITADGDRLYFMSRWNGDSMATAGDIWYSERPTSVPSRSHSRTGEAHPLHIYPNPSNGFAVLESSESLREVWLFNVLGQTIMRHALLPETRSLQINLSSEAGLLPGGVYWVRAAGRTGTYVIPIHVTR